MKNFAVLDDNNKVLNIIVAESKEVAEDVIKKTCIEYNDENPAHIGWDWDGTNFINPTPVLETPTESVGE